MNLLCHRGMWVKKEEQNTVGALMAAVKRGFGVETDVRDNHGRLVVSHDPPVGEDILPLERFLEAYRGADKKPLLALNVKADGLHEQLDQMLQAHGVDNYFVFDMALPDTFGYLKKRMPFAVRLSEYEDGKDLLKYTNTVWLDALEREWYSIDDISTLLNSGKRVCVVSPELHRRSHVQLWERLASVPASLAKNLYLCTDLFEQAQEAFNVIQD